MIGDYTITITIDPETGNYLADFNGVPLSQCIGALEDLLARAKDGTLVKEVVDTDDIWES